MRKKIVAGNWKMNMTPDEAEALVALLAPGAATSSAEIVYCVPAIDIERVVKAVSKSKVKVGAQNMFYEESGAFTGEISAAMLTSAGVTHCVIGHSERRGIFGETDTDVNKKVRKALSAGLTPIMCCGESLEQREEGITLSWIKGQIEAGFAGIAAEDAVRVVVAYEPIWAIGTGRTATDEQAQEVCGTIRSLLGELYGADTAEEISILYGGSVNAGNAASLFAMPDIDGGLVGGASLKADFSVVMNA